MRGENGREGGGSQCISEAVAVAVSNHLKEYKWK